MLDFHMPGMGTVEFLSTLRGLANGKKAFVVYCTTENDTADITRTISAGADDYIIKPFDRESLRTKLAAAGLVDAGPGRRPTIQGLKPQSVSADLCRRRPSFALCWAVPRGSPR